MPRALRVLLLLVLIAVAVVVLFTWVFPWVESQMQDPTIGVSVAGQVIAAALPAS